MIQPCWQRFAVNPWRSSAKPFPPQDSTSQGFGVTKLYPCRLLSLRVPLLLLRQHPNQTTAPRNVQKLKSRSLVFTARFFHFVPPLHELHMTKIHLSKWLFPLPNSSSRRLDDCDFGIFSCSKFVLRCRMRDKKQL